MQRHGDHVFAESFSRHQLFNRGLSGLYCRPHEDEENPDREFETFEHGDKIAEAMKEVILGEEDGTLTGRIQFDPRTNWRMNFSATVIEIKPGVNSLNSIKERFQWAQGEGFLLGENRVFHEKKPDRIATRKGILIDKPWKLVLSVVTVLVKPFVMLKRSNPGEPQLKGIDRFEGYCIDLLHLLAQNISGFEYEVFVSEGNKYGARQADGSWDGMIGYLLNERVQFNRGEFSVSNEFSMYNSLWFTLAAFMQQGTDILPRALSGRIASSAWWFFTLIIVSSYTANLAAFLTHEKMTPPIESVEDLANQNKILYGVVKGGSTAAFFEDSTVPLYKKMWDFMQDIHHMRDQNKESVFVDTYAEGIDRVRESKGKYAFLLEETTNNYEGGRKPCNTMKVGQNLNTLGYGIATKIGNPLRGSINLAILYLQEKGELKRLENKWWYDRGQCEQGSDSGASSSLNLSKVAGIFYILMSGMVLSMLTAFVEFLVRKRKEKREKEKKQLQTMQHRPTIIAACQQVRRRAKSEESRTTIRT
uniref:Glutamate receptor n=1 Tax=Heterorhabditis bacteriophora TaxID=37862 RepID=A0A1I7XS71_HETBA